MARGPLVAGLSVAGSPIDPATRRAVEAVWRIESARLTAGLARFTRDLDLADDLAQDALLAALEQWPGDGVPRNPGAWLMAVGKRRAVDHFRRQDRAQLRRTELGQALEQDQTRDSEAELVDHLDDDIGDDMLRLVFTACHPVLSTEARVTLTLRLLGGLTTQEIARAFLTSEPTVAQRIVRAKRTLAQKKGPLRGAAGASAS